MTTRQRGLGSFLPCIGQRWGLPACDCTRVVNDSSPYLPFAMLPCAGTAVGRPADTQLCLEGMLRAQMTPATPPCSPNRGQVASQSQHSSSSNQPCHAMPCLCHPHTSQPQAPDVPASSAARTSQWSNLLRTQQACPPVILPPCLPSGLYMDAKQAYCRHQGLLQLCRADAGGLP
jgi:hypothetical protein